MSMHRGDESGTRVADRGREVRGDAEEIRAYVDAHQEATVFDLRRERRDRIRWGPVWAGLVVALGTYLLLQLALIATGIVEFNEASTADAVWSAVVAVIGFFLGGVTAGATAMWRGVDDGLLHGIVLWAVGLVAVIALSAVGSGLALGAFDTTDTFDRFTTEDITTDPQVSDDAQEAAGHALLGLSVALVAAAAGAAVGSKMWPTRRDDDSLDLRDRGRDDAGGYAGQGRGSTAGTQQPRR
jgi:hypothetical protein